MFKFKYSSFSNGEILSSGQGLILPDYNSNNKTCKLNSSPSRRLLATSTKPSLPFLKLGKQTLVEAAKRNMRIEPPYTYQMQNQKMFNHHKEKNF